MLAVFVLVLEVAFMFAYGFGAEFDLSSTRFPSTSDNSSHLVLYTLAAVLPLLGWGLILSYSDNSVVSGLVSTLVTAGIYVQLGPLVQAFWSSLFNNTWVGRAPMSILTEV